MMIPKYLYRYRSMNNQGVDRIFTHNEIYCPSPTKFNDPFDCRIPFIMDGTEEDWKKFYNDILKDRYPRMSRNERRKVILGILNDKKHKDQQYHEEASKKTVEVIAGELGMLCLSEKSDDILMWSHYSDAHKGFCLEFDREKPPFNEAEPVIYMSKFQSVNYFKASDEEKKKSLLYTKSLHWEYEKEWRIVFDKQDLHEFPESSLVGVIFGCEMSQKDKNKIKKWVEGRKSQPNIYESKKKEKEFGVEIVLL